IVLFNSFLPDSRILHNIALLFTVYIYLKTLYLFVISVQRLCYFCYNVSFLTAYIICSAVIGKQYNVISRKPVRITLVCEYFELLVITEAGNICYLIILIFVLSVRAR